MNHSIIGIDLATRRYCDIGIALLEADRQHLNCHFLRPLEHGLPDPPKLEVLADYVCRLATQHDVGVIAIDGPQAWKAPENGLIHQRVSEKVLHTQAKTGLPGSCKPATSLRFVRFAIEFFSALEERGWQRQMNADATLERCAIEVFPTAAWRALGCKALPAKSASSSDTVATWLERLQMEINRKNGSLHLSQSPTHDELQALMAGLVGLAFASDKGSRSFGSIPFLLDNEWREGFIVNFE